MKNLAKQLALVAKGILKLNDSESESEMSLEDLLMR
jgi:hypothetical protein